MMNAVGPTYSISCQKNIPLVLWHEFSEKTFSPIPASPSPLCFLHKTGV